MYIHTGGGQAANAKQSAQVAKLQLALGSAAAKLEAAAVKLEARDAQLDGARAELEQLRPGQTRDQFREVLREEIREENRRKSGKAAITALFSSKPREDATVGGGLLGTGVLRGSVSTAQHF